MKNTILSLIRHGLTFGGGFLAAKGLLSDATLSALIPAVVTAVGAIWGAVDEYRAERAAAGAAKVASAE